MKAERQLDVKPFPALGHKRPQRRRGVIDARLCGQRHAYAGGHLLPQMLRQTRHLPRVHGERNIVVRGQPPLFHLFPYARLFLFRQQQPSGLGVASALARYDMLAAHRHPSQRYPASELRRISAIIGFRETHLDLRDRMERPIAESRFALQR